MISNRRFVPLNLGKGMVLPKRYCYEMRAIAENGKQMNAILIGINHYKLITEKRESIGAIGFVID